MDKEIEPFTMADKSLIEKSKTVIKSLTNKIASFPCDIDPRVKAKEQHSLSLGQAFVEIELEKDRVCAVVAKHEEQILPIKSNAQSVSKMSR